MIHHDHTFASERLKYICLASLWENDKISPMGTRHFHIKHQPDGEEPGHYHLTDSAHIDSNYNYQKRGFYGNGQIGIYIFEENGVKKAPHFHIIDHETNGGNLDIEVKISDLSIICIMDKSKHIYRDTRKGLTWEGYEDLRKKLIEFLNKPYTGRDTFIQFRNYYALAVFLWNAYNDDKVERSDWMSRIE